MRITELISGDVAAWTTIVRRQLGAADLTVTAVLADALSPRLTRFQLTLAGHSDPISLVAKKTSTREALFYRDLAPRLGFLTPRCWFGHANRRRGWVVLDDVPQHRPPSSWREGDASRVIGNLAALHTAYWNRAQELQAYEWLDWFILPVDPDAGISLPEPYRFYPYRQEQAVSSHAVANAGPLVEIFLKAATAVEALEALGGWPGVVGAEALVAVRDLLDDPVPMLHTLRTLPPTLIHGAPRPDHWHLTVFADCNLLDWERVALGPAVYDLVSLLEAREQALTRSGLRPSPAASELRFETMVDTYLLRLYESLWPLFDARAMRRALPAARCLYVLVDWLPRLADWFAPLATEAATSGPPTRISDRMLARVGRREAVALRPYLTDLFARFSADYRLL